MLADAIRESRELVAGGLIPLLKIVPMTLRVVVLCVVFGVILIAVAIGFGQLEHCQPLLWCMCGCIAVCVACYMFDFGQRAGELNSRANLARRCRYNQNAQMFAKITAFELGLLKGQTASGSLSAAIGEPSDNVIEALTHDRPCFEPQRKRRAS